MAVTLLLIDDNPDQLLIVRRILSKAEQYEIDAAPNGTEGIARLLAKPYDLILCDYRLPDMNGMEVLKARKAHRNDTPFVIVTSAGSERLAVEVLQEGADDYLVKDAAFDDFLPRIIQRCLERHGDKVKREQLQAERDQALLTLKKEKESLEAMNHIMMDREERILELKREVNELRKQLGQPPQYGA